MRLGIEVGIAALVALLALASQQAQGEEFSPSDNAGHATQRFFDTAGNVFSDYWHGLTTKRPDYSADDIDEEFAREAQGYRDEKIAFYTKTAITLGLPDYCRGKRRDELADQCLASIDEFLRETEIEIRTERAGIKEEFAARRKAR